jgi:tryptophanyl-tRNA synthetase
LYRANYVPVGEDQKQHIELSKKIADTFNKKYKTDFFPIPNPKITGAGTRIMSLKDASKKMSKSEISDLSRINILDTNDQIVKKIRKAKTNSSLFPNNIGGVTQSTEVNNLTNIYSSLTNLKRQEIFNTYCNRLFSTFKKDLTEIIINSVSPIRRRTNEFLQDKDEVRNILRKGSVKAQQIAGSNLLEIQKIIGIRSKNINYVKKNIF